MCGFVGFLDPGKFSLDKAYAVLGAMAEVLRHRGPDDSGLWLDAEAGIALGHRRLSVIDVTDAGHQPMMSDDGRFVLVFNGEIYNHLELRRAFGESAWRGHSDTETLLAGICRWGLEKALRKSTGMFALALWDRDTRTLSLARDRMGEKPLYYGWQGNTFLFGSELKGLRRHPHFLGEIDRHALGLYARRGYIPAPHSIHAGISKLTPGSILEISSGASPGSVRPVHEYWSLAEVVNGVASHRFGGGPEEAVDTLEMALRGAIKRQRIADVPLGVFLSGGTDSSVVAALMQSISSVPVRTFTIGFEEKGYDEAAFARAVAKHLMTDHTELYVSAKEALEVIPELPRIYDEPFADMSQIPTLFVSRLARRHVTVALTGDGGDELFCGYDRYPQTEKNWSQLSLFPQRLRDAMQALLPHGPLAEGIASRNPDVFYCFMNSQWKGYPGLVIGGEEKESTGSPPCVLSDAKERMMYLDGTDYLPDDILVKVDRAAMSASLETRVPLLDHNVVEMAWRLPISVKFRNGITKWPLKRILYKYVPEHLVHRPKMGFGVPIHHWLRGPLRDWAEDLLSENRLRREGYFDPSFVRKEWETHIDGNKDRHYGLWTILMFQSWMKYEQ